MKKLFFLLKKSLVHCDEYTNSLHILRSSSLEIGPWTKIYKSCERMCVLSDHKHIEENYQQDFHGTKVYSSLKYSNLLVKRGLKNHGIIDLFIKIFK